MRALALPMFAALSLASIDAHAAVLTVDCVTGPFLTINAAVGAAANGDTIVVHPCVYNENVVIAGFDDLHLVAAKRPSAAAAGVTGATIVGVGAAPAPTVIIDGSGLPGAGISIQNSRDVSVTGFWVRRCATNGVEVIGSDGTVVVNTRMERNTFAGYFEAQSFEGRLAGNYVLRNGSFGIYLEVTQSLTIEDNRVTSAGRNGIFVAGDRIQVVNNDVQSAGAEGIHVGFGNENRIERNTVINNNTMAGGFSNLKVDAGAALTDVIGNNTLGSITNVGVGTDIADNS